MDSDVPTLAAESRRALGDPAQWSAITGYPDSLALCVIDAIQSTGPTYASVVRVVNRYREFRRAQGANPEVDKPADLIRTFAVVGGVDGWVAQIGNRNRTYSRAHAPYKGQAILEAATALDDLGIETPGDLRSTIGQSQQGLEVERRWRSVVSQSSGVTWRYVLMLAGVDGVKPDRMIMRFVQNALGGPMRTVAQVDALVRAAAAELGVPATTLDHAIWRFESGRADT